MKIIIRFSRVAALKIIAMVCATCLLVPFVRAQTAVGQLSITNWDFGPTLIGCTSPQKNIALTNTGDAQLVMNTISISGPFALPINHCARGVRPGTHCNVYATYSPDFLVTDTGTLTFNDNASNTPQIVTLSGYGATIVPTASTAFKLGTRVFYGQTATLTGQVKSLGGCSIPDGEVMNFYNDVGALYCSGPILAGIGTCTAQILLKAGPHGVHASYPGDAHFQPSESTNPVTVWVNKWGSTTSVTATPNPTSVGQSVTITATVSSPGPYVPTGVVTFYVDNTWKARYLASGIAQISYTFTTAGNSTILVVYKGDVGNSGSRGGLTEVVNP